MVSIEVIALVLTGLGLTASIVYYSNVMQNTEKARRSEILLQRINIIDEDFYDKWVKLFGEPWTTFKEWTDYRDEHPGSYNFIAYLLMTLNSIGALLKQNLIDEETLFEAFSPPLVVWTWMKTSARAQSGTI